ncbi:hypothetical protein BDZ97DRAFT_122813 [Flammula alnicola]|nr:hypothetical protein BDZ97DRAFT_122813 [Flammula alnicola]
MSTFYATVWCARISILLTIIRIGCDRRRCQVLSLVVLLFTLLLSALIGQLFWVCEPQRRQTASRISNCLPNAQMAIVQIVADVFADLTLLISSLQMFRVIQDNSLRHRLKFIFSTCTATTIVSIVHVSFILKSKETKMLIAALVEDSVSLIVSSIPVVANIFFHLNSSDTAGLIHSGIYPSNLQRTLHF